MTKQIQSNMKIRIEELSIGDWVLDAYGTPSQILAIENWSDGHVLNVRIKDIGIGEVPITRVSPIPITQEILERNGFVENLGRWYNSECFMELEPNEGAWDRTINCGEYSVYTIKYVHQLQHAMRLAGINKDIELK